MPYLLSLNCGSSSVKSKLFSFPDDDHSSSDKEILSTLKLVATADASNIGAKGKQVDLQVNWTDDKEAEESVKKDQDEVEYTDIIPIILDLLTGDKKGGKQSFDKKELKYVTHRIVHGSTHQSPIIVTSEHQEGLKEMEKLSEFAPLHNHTAVLAIKATLSALPDSTSVLLFDTLFHQTIESEIYTYAIPKIEHDTPVPLRKYGFHGLSYASVLRTVANHVGEEEKEVNAVVCHLGSGGSVCMIQEGQSKDTSMGLTPLEGLVGGTRSGSVDPTLIFHHTPSCAENALEEDDGRFISKAEMVLNKQSGLQALAGTSDFGTITTRMTDATSCSPSEHTSSTLAYKVYLDRLLHYLSFYLFKLNAHVHTHGGSTPVVVFSGGIGEKGADLRADVMRSLGWIGVSYGKQEEGRNVLKKGEGIKEITDPETKAVRVFAVETDEEVQCALMATTPKPSLEEVTRLLAEPSKGNCVPVFTTLPADLLTPVIAYLRISHGGQNSFLLESITGGENISRYSFIGADPFKVVRSGPEYEVKGDPLIELEKALAVYKYVNIPEIPTFTGGAIGMVTYDCIHHFEPKTARPLTSPFEIPESIFMFHDTLVIFDHLFQNLKLVSHVFLPPSSSAEADIPSLYSTAVSKLDTLRSKLLSDHTPLPIQPPIQPSQGGTSNVGKAGYEAFVTKLKEHIVKGDIIQAVPSQRIARPTTLHPFNAYRQLRSVNPSPYMFYIDFGDLQLVGASPETLCKVEKRKVYNHAIAGTVKRGKTPEEDAALGKGLLASTKDQAEHIMLVDLARNDVNRVCKPETVQVDDLMRLEKFSHVIHLTSQISGMLRDDKSRFDAFRSIFPAGTVSGAPKIKAIELVGGLEGERRGVYAGAVGRFDFDQDHLDTCIAIRTMTFKDGVAYLQAGGGIVHDSVEEDEYIETINKLKANMNCIDLAEAHYATSS